MKKFMKKKRKKERKLLRFSDNLFWKSNFSKRKKNPILAKEKTSNFTKKKKKKNGNK